MDQVEGQVELTEEQPPLTLREFLRYPFRRFLDVDPQIVERVKSMTQNPNETGLDRLKEAWNCYANGEEAVEFSIVTNAASMAGMLGFAFGGILDSRESMQTFIRQHNANIFHGQFRANRALSDTIYLNFFRRGLRAGLRYAIFSGLFVGAMVTSTTYRNDIAFTDCALSGALAGAVWRVQLGPRAVLVTSIVGSIFGLSFAGLMKLSLKICDTSIAEMRHYNRLVLADTSSVQLKVVDH